MGARAGTDGMGKGLVLVNNNNMFFLRERKRENLLALCAGSTGFSKILETKKLKNKKPSKLCKENKNSKCLNILKVMISSIQL